MTTEGLCHRPRSGSRVGISGSGELGRGPTVGWGMGPCANAALAIGRVSGLLGYCVLRAMLSGFVCHEFQQHNTCLLIAFPAT